QVLPFPVQRHRCGTAAGRPDAVEAGVGRHLAEPGSDGPPPLEVADRLQNPHEHLLGGVEGVLPVAKEGVGTPVDAHLIPVEKEGEPLRPPLLAQAYDLVVRVHGLLPRSRRSGAGGLELWTRIPSPRCSAPAMHSAKPPLRSRGRPARGSAWPFTWYYTPRQEKFQGEEEMWDPVPGATGSSQPPQPAGKRGRAQGPGTPAGGPRAGHRATLMTIFSTRSRRFSWPAVKSRPCPSEGNRQATVPAGRAISTTQSAPVRGTGKSATLITSQAASASPFRPAPQQHPQGSQPAAVGPLDKELGQGQR